MAFSSSSTANNYVQLAVGATAKLNFNSNAGGTTRSCATTTSVVAGNWYFHLGRNISSTSRWVVMYDSTTGLIEQVQNTQSSAPTYVTPRFGIGSIPGSSLVNPSNNIVAEAWYADSDIIGNDTNTALSADFVRKLALMGPFACPEISNAIVEYHSLWQATGTAVYAPSISQGDYYSRIGLQAWANPITAANVPVPGPHPPLSPNYVRPGQNAPILVV